MNNENEWRLEVAKKLVNQIKTNEQLVAFFVCGSIAKNLADKNSDLEICCVWSNKLKDDKRKEIIDSLGGFQFTDFQNWNTNHAIEDNIHLEDFQIDIWHTTVDINDTIVNDVLEKHDTNLSKLNLMDTLLNCIPLHDLNGDIERWKEKSSQFPSELSEKIIRENLSVFTNGNSLIHIERNDFTILYGLISGLQKRIFLVLLGLNKVYYPTYKRMTNTLKQLKHKPNGIEDSFETVYQLPAIEAWKETERMMKEVSILVESKFPEIKSKEIIETLKTKRKVEKINL